jgi:hypothetical protein
MKRSTFNLFTLSVLVLSCQKSQNAHDVSSDLKLFRSLADDNNIDGLCGYFANKVDSLRQVGSDAFVIIKTIPGSTPGAHDDYFGSPGVYQCKVVADGAG